MTRSAPAAALALAALLAAAIGCDASAPATDGAGGAATSNGSAGAPTAPDAPARADGRRSALDEVELHVTRAEDGGRPFVVEAGELTVRVWSCGLTLDPKSPELSPGWVYLTDGFRAAGGPEVVLIVKRPEASIEEAFPRAPIQLLGGIRRAAGLARAMEAGSTFNADADLMGSAELSPPAGSPEAARGPLDGLLLVDPEDAIPPIEPAVAVPSDALLGVLLTADELNLVRQHGPYRVLDRLANASGVYPFPAWCDPTRAAVASEGMTAASMLSRMARMRWLPLTTRFRDGTLTVHASRASAEARAVDLEAILRADAFAFLTGPDRAAPARAYWTPGSKDPEVIVRPGETLDASGPDLTGCFLIVVLDERSKQDRGIFVEDGFALTLTRDGLRRVREAIRSREALDLALENGPLRRLELRWVP